LAAATGRISRNSIESRLMAAGRATADLLLYQHLPQILGQLHSTGTVPDFAALTRDLFRWPYASGEVIKRWMTDFYRAVDAPKTPAAETPSPSATAVAH
jgi:CRISPR type I-E-associated protein CasB/Cse2